MDPEADGVWIYRMMPQPGEDFTAMTWQDHERRADILRASPLLLARLERLVKLGERAWGKRDVNSPEQRALRAAREAIYLAKCPDEEDK